jgi:hypothetical protein
VCKDVGVSIPSVYVWVCLYYQCMCGCVYAISVCVGVSMPSVYVWVCLCHQCMCGCVECLLMLLNVPSCNWPDMGLRHTSCPPHQAGG